MCILRILIIRTLIPRLENISLCIHNYNYKNKNKNDIDDDDDYHSLKMPISVISYPCCNCIPQIQLLDKLKCKMKIFCQYFWIRNIFVKIRKEAKFRYTNLPIGLDKKEFWWFTCFQSLYKTLFQLLSYVDCLLINKEDTAD